MRSTGFWEKIFYLVIFLQLALVFHPWFSDLPISSGDLTYFYKENMKEFLGPPLSWESFRNTGLGGKAVLFQGAYFYNLPLGLLANFFEYQIIERIIWVWPILVLAILFPLVLYRIVGLPKKFAIFSSLIFALNTYFLMIVSGGQITVSLGYVMIPLVLALFWKAFYSFTWNSVLLFSLVLSFLVAFDFRFAYLFFLTILIYFLFLLLAEFSGRNFYKLTLSYSKALLPAFLVNIGIHAYWLLPMVISRATGIEDLGKAYTSAEAVRYFSFASFSKAISLFHPNWPENVFGKVGFLRPEFLILPIIAFSSLLFLGREKDKKIKKTILFFGFLALIGSFLAKGSNPPFGVIYLWLFKNFPGMVMFRDATKFYTLVSISYAILIPWVLSKFKGKKFKFLPLLFVLFWLFLIPQGWLGKLGGTLKPKLVPKDYVFLKDFLVSQDNFFRTLWLPTKQRFAFYSDQHPVISAQDWVADEKCSPPFCDLKIEKYNRDYFNCYPNEHCFPADFSFLASSEASEILSQLSVKYLIIPYDSEGEIFLKERKYDEEGWKQLIEFVESLGTYQRVDLPGEIRIYQLPESAREHFWIADDKAEASYKMINPTKYLVQVRNASQPFSLVFSETYDRLWEAKIGERIIPSMRYNGLNSFTLDQTGDFEMIVEFAAQRYVYYGLVISGATISFMLLYYLIFLLRKR